MTLLSTFNEQTLRFHNWTNRKSTKTIRERIMESFTFTCTSFNTFVIKLGKKLYIYTFIYIDFFLLQYCYSISFHWIFRCLKVRATELRAPSFENIAHNMKITYIYGEISYLIDVGTDYRMVGRRYCCCYHFWNKTRLIASRLTNCGMLTSLSFSLYNNI